jgi:hypothetical protein
MWKGSTYSQVYSLTVFSKSDSTIINPAVTESNTTVEDNPTDAEEHASSSTDNEPSEEVSSPLELDTSSSVNQEPGENNSGYKPKPNKKKRTFMVRTAGQTQKVIPSAIVGEPPVMVSSRSQRQWPIYPKRRKVRKRRRYGWQGGDRDGRRGKKRRGIIKAVLCLRINYKQRGNLSHTITMMVQIIMVNGCLDQERR